MPHFLGEQRVCVAAKDAAMSHSSRSMVGQERQLEGLQGRERQMGLIYFFELRIWKKEIREIKIRTQ